MCLRICLLPYNYEGNLCTHPSLHSLWNIINTSKSWKWMVHGALHFFRRLFAGIQRTFLCYLKEYSQVYYICIQTTTQCSVRSQSNCTETVSRTHTINQPTCSCARQYYWLSVISYLGNLVTSSSKPKFICMSACGSLHCILLVCWLHTHSSIHSQTLVLVRACACHPGAFSCPVHANSGDNIVAAVFRDACILKVVTHRDDKTLSA